MIDRRRHMDEGTRAIISEISRKISDDQYEKIERIVKERNEYFDEKFECLKKQITVIGTAIENTKIIGCDSAVNHIKEHKEKEKRIIKNVTVVSTTIPTVILLGSWIKGMIIGWIQKPPD